MWLLQRLPSTFTLIDDARRGVILSKVQNHSNRDMRIGYTRVYDQ